MMVVLDYHLLNTDLRLRTQFSVMPMCMTSASEFALHKCGAISDVSIIIVIIIGIARAEYFLFKVQVCRRQLQVHCGSWPDCILRDDLLFGSPGTYISCHFHINSCPYHFVLSFMIIIFVNLYFTR